MSYDQAVKWGRRHPKGTRQLMHFSTGSGFWPSQAWLEEDWTPYVDLCRECGVEPMSMEDWYNRGCGALGQCAQQLEMQRMRERRRIETMREVNAEKIARWQLELDHLNNKPSRWGEARRFAGRSAGIQLARIDWLYAHIAAANTRRD